MLGRDFFADVLSFCDHSTPAEYNYLKINRKYIFTGLCDIYGAIRACGVPTVSCDRHPYSRSSVSPIRGTNRRNRIWQLPMPTSNRPDLLSLSSYIKNAIPVNACVPTFPGYVKHSIRCGTGVLLEPRNFTFPILQSPLFRAPSRPAFDCSETSNYTPERRCILASTKRLLQVATFKT